MNWPIEILGLIATVLAAAGVVLNNRMNRACFTLWIMSNTLSLMIHADAGLWSMALRDVIFLVLAVEGLFRWKNIIHHPPCSRPSRQAKRRRNTKGEIENV